MTRTTLTLSFESDEYYEPSTVISTIYMADAELLRALEDEIGVEVMRDIIEQHDQQNSLFGMGDETEYEKSTAGLICSISAPEGMSDGETTIFETEFYCLMGGAFYKPLNENSQYNMVILDDLEDEAPLRERLEAVDKYLSDKGDIGTTINRLLEAKHIYDGDEDYQTHIQNVESIRNFLVLLKAYEIESITSILARFDLESRRVFEIMPWLTHTMLCWAANTDICCKVPCLSPLALPLLVKPAAILSFHSCPNHCLLLASIKALNGALTEPM